MAWQVSQLSIVMLTRNLPFLSTVEATAGRAASSTTISTIIAVASCTFTFIGVSISLRSTIGVTKATRSGLIERGSSTAAIVPATATCSRSIPRHCEWLLRKSRVCIIYEVKVLVSEVVKFLMKKSLEGIEVEKIEDINNRRVHKRVKIGC